MKKLNTIIFSLLIAVSFCISCTKENSPLIETSGIVQYSGETVTDGCGWTIKVNSMSFKPIKELPENFKIIGLPVNVTYRKLNGEIRCASSYIEVVQIKTRD